MTAHTNDPAHTITSADGTQVPLPQEYICPLTLDVMSEPLLSKEGHNYEREAILSWIAEHGTSPLTREPLRPSQLVRNRILEAKIRFFLKQHGAVEETVVNEDGDDGTAKFVGYVVSDSKQGVDPVQSITLQDLASSSLQARRGPPSPVALPEPQSPLSVDHVTERRRQIAELLAGAMAELDEF